MSVAIRLSASFLLLAVAGNGLAQAVEFAQRDPTFPPRDYTCRVDGQDVALGERRCLRTAQGTQLAECTVSLNMSSWKASGSCP